MPIDFLCLQACNLYDIYFHKMSTEREMTTTNHTTVLHNLLFYPALPTPGAGDFFAQKTLMERNKYGKF